MRVRKKEWARPELEDANFVITSSDKYSENYKGRWHEEFKNSNPIYLELGCGTGKFISENAVKNQDINYIGIDFKDEILVYAKRTVKETLYLKDEYVENIRLIPMQIEFIENIFERDEISRVFINFCNPWPKRAHNKRRLTYNYFLEKYKGFMKANSQIWFKTDDRGLFDDSQEYLKSSGFVIRYQTYDLHKSNFEENITTEYEERFTSQGMPIMFLIAEMS
ncbi:tRNA (guanosine(46)-N7)-methyltransferase TrmB [Tissierella creatinini]|nr:tRNA (guanosine(46)-N7)-methyltransferase TrmB [Tissierella creatinini]TJX63788.1 tRNA (guanosine(46)-N7)-methyltransferase TrmB [Soehngenia saccharolytica]